MDDEFEPVESDITRRTLIRRGALVGTGVVWATPVIQTISASPAHAAGSPAECFHSLGQVTRNGVVVGTGGCKEAVAAACNEVSATASNCAVPASPAEKICCTGCPTGAGGENPCCSVSLCRVECFTCTGKGTRREVCYTCGAGTTCHFTLKPASNGRPPCFQQG